MKKNWFKKYINMNSSHFTYENGGNYLQIVLPYKVSNVGIEDRGRIANSRRFHPIGYCLNIPDSTKYIGDIECEQVGIMFENEKGERVWFHYPKN